jgi:hypothetical protein
MSSKTKKELTAEIGRYKQTIEHLVKANDELSIAIQQALEEKEEWFEHADKAHKEQEALLSLLKYLSNTAIQNLMKVSVDTKGITVIDMVYHIGIIRRTIEAKFNPKTEEED